MGKMLKPVSNAYARPWAFLVAVSLAACNLFNPTGKGDPGGDGDAQLALGQSLFRQQDFEGSMRAFEKAIARDSSSSLAYYGYAKAAMKYYGLTATSILEEVGSFNPGEGGAAIPFLTEEDEVLTTYLQATSKVRRVLAILTERDTLTRWYNYMLDPESRSARRDPRSAARIAFIQAYLENAGKGLPGYRGRSRFPLSDLRLGYDKVAADYGLTEMLYALVHLRDLDANDTIDHRDDLLKKITFSVSGGFTVDSLQNIAEDLKSEENRENVNRLIQNVSSGMNSASTVIGLVGSLSANTGNDSLSNEALTAEVVDNMDSVISSLGSAVSFYQFGDGLDNDGDGCVDEEILDGKDNDGDGFVDEDARLELQDGVDNDRNGSEGPEELVDPLDSGLRLVFTSQAGWSTGPRYRDKEFRSWVQADSAKSQIVIDSAKAEIGGCWNNY